MADKLGIKQTPKSTLDAAAKSRGLKIVDQEFIDKLEAMGLKTSKQKLVNFGVSGKPIGEIVTVAGFSVVLDKTQGPDGQGEKNVG